MILNRPSWSLAVAGGMRYFFKTRCAACSRWCSEGLCLDCRARFERSESELFSPPLRRFFALGDYRGGLRDAIRRFKFQGRFDLALDLGRMLSEFELPAGLVVPVPLAPGRLAMRGYNQSELLARVIAKKKGLSFANVLRRRFETVPQFSLGKRERWANLKDAFEVSGDFTGEQRVILIDDIYTSGATVHWAGKALQEAGIKEVWFRVAARARHQDP